jgi:subtilisin family serine protease
MKLVKSLALLVAVGLGVSVAAAPRVDAAAEPSKAPTVDYVFEIEPGEDLAHWVDFALDEAGVAAAKRCVARLDPAAAAGSDPGECRVVVGLEPAINGAWLHLSNEEALAVAELDSNEGFRSLVRSTFLNAEWLEDDVSVLGSDGRVPAWPDQRTPAGIGRVDGGQVADYSNSELLVGVVDTGIDRFHEDLNVVGGYDCTFGGPADDWGVDRQGHGTHVGGTIGALDNGRGVEGVAPGIPLGAYKVFGDDGGASYAGVLCGVARAMGDGADVINMSLGGGNEQSVCGSWDSMHNAICNATDEGIAVVVAAGNDTGDSVFKSPANYPEAITVSALATFGDERPGSNAPPVGCGDYPQIDNELAWFSNTGVMVDVIAPGVCVQSTYPGNQYAVASGTSMATPHAAGVIAAYADATGLSGAAAAQGAIAYAGNYNSRWDGDVDYDHEPLIVVPG